MFESPGERFVRAAARRDWAGAAGLLADDVEFRALTPHGLREARGPLEVLVVLRDWFSPVEAIEAIAAGTVVDRPSVRYRIRWRSAEEGRFVFEQQAYYEVAGGRISRIHIVCSGDRPIEGEPGEPSPALPATTAGQGGETA